MAAVEMKCKVMSIILALYALIGFLVLFLSDLASFVAGFICLILFVVIPASSAYGVWTKNRYAFILAIILFSFQSIRALDYDGLIPLIRPITVSFPYTSFIDQRVYLIDYFAITMVIFLVILLKQVTKSTSDK